MSDMKFILQLQSTVCCLGTLLCALRAMRVTGEEKGTGGPRINVVNSRHYHQPDEGKQLLHDLRLMTDVRVCWM